MRIADCGLRITGYLLSILVALACSVAAPVYPADKAAPHAPSAEKRAAAPEALKEVDALLKRTGEITGLPVLRPVKSAIASREEIQRYIRGRLQETTTPGKLRAQEVALKKFGLLPPDFELEAFTVKLLAEQATAYYDPRRKQFYIADWTPVALQRPAIIHELTHALQDQHVGLDNFLQQDDLSQDEQMARAAVIEGGGVLAMMEYILSLAGMKKETFPNLDEAVTSATTAEINKFPVYAAAPFYLRESLLFPYTAGMQYVRWLVEKQGKTGYAAALKNPPRSTAEVLHPGRAVAPANDLRPPEVSPLPPGYKLLDSDVLGELDVRILLQQHAGEETSRSLAPAWRGFRYAVYENESRSAAFLTHRSRWENAGAAAAFADAYRKVLAAKGEKNAQVQIEADTVTVHEGVPAAKTQSSREAKGARSGHAGSGSVSACSRFS